MTGYAVALAPDDNDTLVVTCRDLPAVATFGDTEADALHHAVDAIETVLASMIEDGEPIPRPSAPRGEERVVPLPLLTTIKVELYRSLGDAGISRAELTRRLGWKRESVDRLFRLDHRSRLEQIEAAFAVLGREVDLVVHDRAA